MRTARVTVLMKPEEKKDLEARAKRRGVSSGEYLRLAVDNFAKVSGEDDLEAELEALTRELENSIPKMTASFDAIERSLAGSRAAVKEAIDHFEGKKS